MKGKITILAIFMILCPTFGIAASLTDNLVEIGYKHYYHKDTVQKIDDNICEVVDETVDHGSNILRTLRFKCKEKEYAIGRTYGYKYGALVSDMDLSRNGWVWFPIKNTDKDEKELMKAICRPKKKK